MAAAASVDRAPEATAPLRAPVEEVLDVPYRTDMAHAKAQLDIYKPAGAGAVSALAPTVVFVHGGGYKRFDKRTLLGMHGNVGRALARRGFVAVLPNYRLSVLTWDALLLANGLLALVAALITAAVLASQTEGWVLLWLPAAVFGGALVALVLLQWALRRCLWLPQSTVWPGHAEDVALAVGWAAANIAAHGGDPHRIILMGHSAGAHIAMYLALNPAVLSPHGVRVAGVVRGRGGAGATAAADPEDVMLASAGPADARGTVRGVIGMSGVYDFAVMHSGCFTRLWMLKAAFPDAVRRQSEWFAVQQLAGYPAPTDEAAAPGHGPGGGLVRPPVLLSTAERGNDHGLDDQADLLARELARLAFEHSRVEVVGTGHISECMGIGRAGHPAERILMPAVEAFVAKWTRLDVDSARAGP